MCGPMAIALAAAATSTASAGMGALSANAQSKYRAKVAERNAALDREAAQQEQQNTREAAQAHYRKVAQLKGEQRARAGAAGVGLDFGTAADVFADTDMLAREDVDRIYRSGAERVRGFEIGASNNMASANASRQAGKGALVQGAFNVGSSILGGAQQYNKIRAARG